MELGVYSFGDTQRNPDGSLRSTAEAIGNLFEARVITKNVVALWQTLSHGSRQGFHC